MAAFAFPALDPIAFSVGPLAVRWYGLAYLAGFLFAWWVLRVLDARWGLGIGPDGRANIMLAAVVGVVVGGRLGYVLFYGAGSYWRAPLSIFALWDGGMSFHGGLVGVLAAGWWIARRQGVPFLRLADVGAVAAPVGLLLGRLANFVNGELWGRVTDVPWGVVFPRAGVLPRHPSQLYEAGLEGVVLGVVMLLLARRRRGDGELLGWMIGLYGVFRIAVEFFREPDAQITFLPAWVTMGQLLSVPLVALGVWLVWRAKTRSAAAHKPGGSSASGSEDTSRVSP